MEGTSGQALAVNQGKVLVGPSSNANMAVVHRINAPPRATAHLQVTRRPRSKWVVRGAVASERVSVRYSLLPLKTRAKFREGGQDIFEEYLPKITAFHGRNNQNVLGKQGIHCRVTGNFPRNNRDRCDIGTNWRNHQMAIAKLDSFPMSFDQPFPPVGSSYEGRGICALRTGPPGQMSPIRINRLNHHTNDAML